jgi:hypothetical protein
MIDGFLLRKKPILRSSLSVRGRITVAQGVAQFLQKVPPVREGIEQERTEETESEEYRPISALMGNYFRGK